MPGIIGATIITRGGTYYDYENPAASVYDIYDIAAALSRICRFTGHLLDSVEHYSVAQHSVIVSHIVEPEHAYAALMHDAVEFVVGDMNGPLKQLVPEYKAIEKRCEAELFARFRVPHPLHPSVKRADLIALFTEKRDLTAGAGHDWPGAENYPPLAKKIHPWRQAEAMYRFLTRFEELTGGLDTPAAAPSLDPDAEVASIVKESGLPEHVVRKALAEAAA
ncbi:hypothetical protein [Phenylobacterium ferrooxidans]|uniref:Phosphohydrolase n=1 Tax=Phenylobacterium ferrooxidans TaxID=2982689 RepID=A0ABW6CJ97_9CAUL